ncbi:hypothetical protein H1230_26185 [Paenibacillus sp. 19GGS1-52]|uniref:TadE/TadG family type IV pilus assembly protein n=1 Tax=Paenibacillus sp. 19GGS1-52 TaxID=2758563 RepID=UPI001EFB5B87|nr:hypothetical protein [Paenibacillus sp. 19GGS1-52]ULO06469.1 hypothetical protein H1230_26185 [Paenibacillus sp. 19GGS1-52]
MKRTVARSYSNGRRRSRWGYHEIEGSVSIFLIMVLAFVFLFATVLIDYARIAAMHVQGERLARAGARSVLSAYDKELRENYGLFAFGDSDGSLLLSRVLNDNLHKSGREDGFNPLTLGLESSSLNFSRSLGSYDVFRRQINEEMKYKAPIDFALELAGKFKPLSAAMGEASQATKVLSKLQPLYDAREEALDLMQERRRQAAESGESLLQLIMNPPQDSIVPSVLGNVTSAADIAAQYNDYIGKYYADMYRDSKKRPQYTNELASYLRQSAEIRSRIPTTFLTFRTDHERLIEEAQNALKRARELNEEMEAVLEQSRSNGVGSGQDQTANWDIPGSSDGMSTDILMKLREQEDSLILSSADFGSMENNLSTQGQAYLAIAPLVNVLLNVLSQASGINGDNSQMFAAVLGASHIIDSYLQNYGVHGAILASETAQIEEHRSSDKERKQTEREAKSKLGDAMKMLDKIKDLKDQAGESLERYETLNQYYEDSVSFNEGLESETSQAAQSETDPYAAGDSAMSSMDGIYAAMGSIMEGARDRLFQTEYSALYFQHFDVTKLAALTLDAEGTAPQQLIDQLDPQAQELEYILYGFHNPVGNVAAAYGEIFGMRLAIRTMEGFIEKAALGNPLAILAAALLYGIEQAVQDMLLLCEKDAVPLSKYMPAQLSYRDHLRLFMMLHGSGESQLSRMLALIRLNTGINPAEKNTYVAADIKLGMRLWFLPGVIKLLNYGGGSSGDVQGKVYYRAVKADFSY